MVNYATMNEVIRLITIIGQGKPEAAEQLLPLVYDELRKLAAVRIAAEAPGNTLSATALVHEAYLRMVGDQQFDGRGHFFAAAAEAMRRILVDRARRKAAVRNGGGLVRLDLMPEITAAPEVHEDLIALDEALRQLETEDPLKAELVKLRYFGGLTLAEAAATMGLAERTAGRHWTYARAWLRRAIETNEKKS
ncbi:ECF-type sigma factor [Neorhodopirellula pilleata]|uniref:ECF sigma factor n=1 Tax=Neorhodopirellula pilleata TaxID=2714738 RepID=A0A5C6AHY4_9BACT|nr:ECF-type sigma factor [Neorhodopirellula pilleata]TWT99020.1 ECF sigma factor [Neorhodopirellula pilleata]